MASWVRPRNNKGRFVKKTAGKERFFRVLPYVFVGMAFGFDVVVFIKVLFFQQ